MVSSVIATCAAKGVRVSSMVSIPLVGSSRADTRNVRIRSRRSPVNMDKELAGRAAIVTGAGGGIGAAIAVALANAGASVLVADVDEAGASATVTTIEKAGGRALAVKTDVTESTQVRSMVLAAVERLGSADILVNNAG